jgi:cellulose synthase/poly-beta-1,6-N-acetylglucosamine synthase-like glycosyltransferase
MAVLICSYKRVDDLARCLGALKHQTRPPDDVIVIARDTDKPTIDFLRASTDRQLPLRTVYVAEPGLVAARRKGLSACSSDVAAFIDDDTVPCPEWAQRIMSHFCRDPHLGGLGGKDHCVHGQTDKDRNDNVGRVRWYGRIEGYHHVGYGPAREVQHIKGANMAYRMAALVGVGPDTRLRGNGVQGFEDTTLSLAVRRSGWRILYDPQVLVDHLESPRDEVRFYSHTVPVTDVAGFENLAFNNVVALWDELSPFRMLVFATWSFAIGVRVCPGIIQAIRFTPSMGLVASWYRFFVAQRGLFKAYLVLSRRSNEGAVVHSRSAA